MSTPETSAPLIYSAMVTILADVEAIKKDRDNKAQGFKFRGIDDVYNALHTSFAKAGVFMTTDVLTSDVRQAATKSGGTMNFISLMCKFTFHAKDGSSVSSTILGEASDTGDKGTNKALAIAHKYCLLQAFLIPTEEQKDPDSESNEVTHPGSQRQNTQSSVSTGYKKPDKNPVVVDPYEGLPEQREIVKAQAKAIGIKNLAYYTLFNEKFANKPMATLTEALARFVIDNPQAIKG